MLISEIFIYFLGDSKGHRSSASDQKVLKAIGRGFDVTDPVTVRRDAADSGTRPPMGTLRLRVFQLGNRNSTI